jgi:hypothetical protein
MEPIDWQALEQFEHDSTERICRHFFPLGKKVGQEWKIGDVSGVAGKSLGIQLTGDRASLWHDRATGEGTGKKLRNLIAASRSISDEDAVEEIERAFGKTFRVAFRKNGSNSTPKYIYSGTPPANDPTLSDRWLKALEFAKRNIDHLAEQRGFSTAFCEQIIGTGLIGMEGGKWCFPVYSAGGSLAAIQKRTNSKEWFYDPPGQPVNPLIVGDIQNAKNVHAFESNFDLFAALEKLGHSDDVAFLSTRGVSNAKLVAQYALESATVYAWVQNDDPGRKWLADLGAVHAVRVPEKFKDVNDWTRDGAGKEDLEHAVLTATSNKPTWEQCLKIGGCTSLSLKTLSIKPREPVFDDWCHVGDLGFIYAARGLGKTWLAMHLAHGAATKTNVGEWETMKQLKVLYIDGEMPPQDIKLRDAVLGKPTENLVYVNHQLLFERTGKVINLALSEVQDGIFDSCKNSEFNMLCLDNLSTLASGVDENKSIDWEVIQPWLLRLRRIGITVLFIHHAGRNNEMRGSSKREDPASWVIRLDHPIKTEEGNGAHFISRFTKWRSAKQPKTYEWKYCPINGEVIVNVTEADPMSVFISHVESGLDTCTMIAQEMGISPGHVSRLATRAEQIGILRKKGRKYEAI